MKRFKRGQKLRHRSSGEICEIVRDKGTPKVLVRINGIVLSVLRDNLEEVRDGDEDNRERV